MTNGRPAMNNICKEHNQSWKHFNIRFTALNAIIHTHAHIHIIIIIQRRPVRRESLQGRHTYICTWLYLTGQFFHGDCGLALVKLWHNSTVNDTPRLSSGELLHFMQVYPPCCPSSQPSGYSTGTCLGSDMTGFKPRPSHLSTADMLQE